MKVAQLCQLFATPRTIQSMEFSRPILEWVPFPFPGDLPNPGIEPSSPALRADFLPAEPPGKPEGEQLTKLKNKQTKKKPTNLCYSATCCKTKERKKVKWLSPTLRPRGL